MVRACYKSTGDERLDMSSVPSSDTVRAGGVDAGDTLSLRMGEPGAVAARSFPRVVAVRTCTHCSIVSITLRRAPV